MFNVCFSKKSDAGTVSSIVRYMDLRERTSYMCLERTKRVEILV